MDKMVSDDEKRGKSKWAVMESKRLKAEGQETPAWMNELVEEDQKWANRWAACKSAELKAQGEEVPAWMADNARKGIMDYASEKAAEIQEQIEMLDEEKEKEETIVEAQGDIKLAAERIQARMKRDQSTTPSRQLAVLESAVENLDQVDEEVKRIVSEQYARGPRGRPHGSSLRVRATSCAEALVPSTPRAEHQARERR